MGKEKSKEPDLCYDIGTFIAKENCGHKGILQGDVIFADLGLKSFGDFFGTLRSLGHGDKLKYKLPKPKKCRIIFFSRFNLNCIGHYIDFQPILWKTINFASKMRYQRAILSFEIPADGKSHKVTWKIEMIGWSTLGR